VCTDDDALDDVAAAVAQHLDLHGRALDLAQQVAQGRVLVERDGEVVELLVKRPRRLVADRRHQTCSSRPPRTHAHVQRSALEPSQMGVCTRSRCVCQRAHWFSRGC
jgi:hypothetical protein